MSRSRARVGVVVVTGRKISAAIGERAKSTGAELIVITVEIVPAKLIDDEDHQQLGRSLICGAEGRRRGQKDDQQNDRFGAEHVGNSVPTQPNLSFCWSSFWPRRRPSAPHIRLR